MAELILADITCKQGKLHNTYIYDITWVDIVDLTVYMTVVDESMRNWTRSHWDIICTGDTPHGLYTGLIKTARRDKDGLQVISADSMPNCITPLTAREVEQAIEARKEALGLA